MNIQTLKFLDQKIVLNVQNWRRPFLNRFFVFVTYSGTGKAWFVFALVVNILNFTGIHFVANQAQFLRSMFCPLLAWILGSFAKKIISRDRPSEKIVGYVRLIQSPTCGSFPSSHAASAVAFFAALLMIQHPIAPIVGLWALAVSFSRLYLGVHYLSDIIGGSIIGLLTAYVFSAAGAL